jgi:hypothetical protein
MKELSRMDLLTALLHDSCTGTVVPTVLEIVEQDPLATAGLFAGDLVRGLMEVPGHFWARHAQLYERHRAVVRSAALARRRMPVEVRMEFWSSLDLQDCRRE